MSSGNRPPKLDKDFHKEHIYLGDATVVDGVKLPIYVDGNTGLVYVCNDTHYIVDFIQLRFDLDKCNFIVRALDGKHLEPPIVSRRHVFGGSTKLCYLEYYYKGADDCLIWYDSYVTVSMRNSVRYYGRQERKTD